MARRKSSSAKAASKKKCNKLRQNRIQTKSVDSSCEQSGPFKQGMPKTDIRNTSNIPSALPTRCVLASHHQGHISFGYAAGRQCMPSAYCSIVIHHKIKSAHTWTADDIERLLRCGSEMYKKHKPVNSGFFSIEELPRQFTLANFHIVVEDIFCEPGQINHALSHNSNTAMFCEQLNNVLSSSDKSISNAALLTMSGVTTAILKSETGYVIFDSHSRNRFGRPSPIGSAGLFCFSEANSLCSYIIGQSRLLTSDSNVVFELCRVKFDTTVTVHPSSISSQNGVSTPMCNKESKTVATIDNAEDNKVISAHSCSTVVVTPLFKEESEILKQSTLLAPSVANTIEAQHKSDVPPMHAHTPSSKTRRKSYYQANADYREKVKKRSRERYAMEVEYRDAKRSKSVEQYLTNEECRKNLKTYSIEKYASNVQHRDSVKSYSVEKYARNVEHRDNVKSYSVKKYASNVEHRDSVKSFSAEKYAKKEAHRENKKSGSIQKYANNTEHRDSVKSYSVEKYASNVEHRDSVKSYSVEKYASDVEHRENLKTRSHETFKKKISKRSNIADAIKEFKREAVKGPTNVCCVCHRLLFDSQVKLCKPSCYIDQEIVTKCLTFKYQHFRCTDRCNKSCKGSLNICHTCHNHISRGNIPPQAVVNDMQLFERDETFHSLNSLEHQLISLCLPFEKLITLVRSRQKAIRGPVVCVPSNINTVTAALPISLHDSKIIPIKLKRRLVYKGYTEYQLVDTCKLGKALQKLMDINPFYSDIRINTDWMDSIYEGDNVLGDLVVNNTEKDGCDIMEDEDKEDGYEPCEIIDGNVMDSCLQPIDLLSELNLNSINSVSIAPAEGNQPLSVMSAKDLEAKSFPALFPDGKNTYDEQRAVKLSRSKYYNARMFSVDTRFASNTQYIFFAQYAYETEQLLNSISINLRKGSNAKHITPDMLTHKESLRSILKSDQGFKFFQTIRGSPEFWNKTMNDLFAMLRNIGLPTFFVTLSSAELSRWTCHLGAILKQSGDYRSDEEISNMDYKNKCKVLKSNPVTAVRMFYHRVEQFFKFLLGPSNPIGEIRDYFYRIEFQARGAPHLHCLIWVETAPRYGVESNDVVCKFIDQYISTTLPNKAIDPELYEIANGVQMHSRSHSVSCKKGKTKKCRFNFPKPVSDKTFIAEPQDHATLVEEHEKKLKKMFELLSQSTEIDQNDSVYRQSGFGSFSDFQEAMKHVTKKPSIVMRRCSGDIWVNNFNPDLLRAWNANMDIQYVLDAYSCIMYIVSYISKSEAELGLILKKARDTIIEQGEDCNSANQMRQLSHKYFTHREILVQEAVVRLCGLKLKQFSRQVVFVPTNEEDIRMSIPLNQIKQTSENDQSSIWMVSLYDRYCARPKTILFEKMSLASFAADYRILAKSEIKKCAGSKNLYQLQNDLGYILERSHSQPAIIRYTRFSETAQTEKFHLSLLKLYLPHRNISQLKPKGYDSYQDFYESAAVKIDNTTEKVSNIVRRNQKLINADNSDIDNAWELLQTAGDLEDAWASTIGSNIECDRQDQMLEHSEITENGETGTEQEIPDLSMNNNNRNVTERSLCSYESVNDNVRPLLQSMNSKQKEIFYYVRQWCLEKKQGVNVDPFHVFVTGGAGVGKSHLIKCIYNVSYKLLKNSDSPDDITVLLLAPTGTAAHNISGHTIHSALKIPPKPKSLYQPLSSDTLNSLQAVLENVQIIIVDEFSMVSPKLLEYMDGRLRQIKGISQSDESACFGSVSILAVGDFYQLPPVKAHALVVPMYKHGDMLFRDKFKQVELTEVMRQKDDATFARVLNKLRIRHKEEDLESDTINMLNTRLECHNEPCDALHVYATNAAADSYNNEMVFKVCDTVHTLNACDYLKNTTTGKMSKLAVVRKGSSTDLPDKIKIGVNCRVMLTKNLDVENGLVNGVFGTVVGIARDESEEDTVKDIYVKFDSAKIGLNLNPIIPDNLPKGTMVITRCDSQLDQHSNICRRQFPLKIGYACTVHKTQGMSVDKIVYDMKGTFVAGQAYVALSRVTSLNGLYLKNFNPNHIYMNETIHKSLQHIPQLCLDNFNSDKNTDLVLHNVQGLHSKIDDIRLGYSRRCKIMCVTETWLKPKQSSSSLRIDGFNIFRADRSAGSGRGGVAMYVADEIFVERVLMPSNRNLEILINKVYAKSQLVVICCIYRSPITKSNLAIESLSKAIAIAESVEGTSSVVFVGDFNENLLLNGNCPIQEFFTDKGYGQVVKDSTYITGSLLDAVYVKGTANLRAKVNPTYFSDHESIEIIFAS